MVMVTSVYVSKEKNNSGKNVRYRYNMIPLAAGRFNQYELNLMEEIDFKFEPQMTEEDKQKVLSKWSHKLISGGDGGGG